MGISDGLFSKAKIVLGVGSVKGTSINDDRFFGERGLKGPPKILRGVQK